MAPCIEWALEAMFNLTPPIPSYVLQTAEWAPFVISASVANACGVK